MEEKSALKGMQESWMKISPPLAGTTTWITAIQRSVCRGYQEMMHDETWRRAKDRIKVKARLPGCNGDKDEPKAKRRLRGKKNTWTITSLEKFTTGMALAWKQSKVLFLCYCLDSWLFQSWCSLLHFWSAREPDGDEDRMPHGAVETLFLSLH